MENIMDNYPVHNGYLLHKIPSNIFQQLPHILSSPSAVKSICIIPRQLITHPVYFH